MKNYSAPVSTSATAKSHRNVIMSLLFGVSVGLVASLMYACSSHNIDPTGIVRDSAMIIRCELTSNNEGTYRLAEIMKDDGRVVLKHAQGDVVRLRALVEKRGDEVLTSERIILIGRPDPRIQVIEYRTYAELYVIDGRIPGLGGIRVAELRTVISRTKD